MTSPKKLPGEKFPGEIKLSRTAVVLTIVSSIVLIGVAVVQYKHSKLAISRLEEEKKKLRT